MKQEALVLCLTNEVAAEFTANALLAIGATPVMVRDKDAALDLVQKAKSVLINIGTADGAQVEAMRAVARLCAETRKPWVLDPVACQAVGSYRRLTKEFVALSPTLIRGNAGELAAICRDFPALNMQTPYLATAEVDVIGDGRGTLTEVSGGVPMLQRVTATGCAQGAICAAALAWGKVPSEAALWASRLMKRAGERAWARANTPGSFKVALVDALWELTHD